MSTVLFVLHFLAGFIVLAEALNKLERTAPCRRGRIGWRARTTEWLKAIAWALLAVAGAGALVSPPTLQDLCAMVGFATLIVRTRVKEG